VVIHIAMVVRRGLLFYVVDAISYITFFEVSE
jgi:hypothetical protein